MIDKSVAGKIVNNCITEIAKHIMQKFVELPKVAVKNDVFAGVVDAMFFECNCVKDFRQGHIGNSKRIESILLLAVRLNSKERIYAKGYTVILVPSNMKNDYFVGEYLSNSITFLKKNEVTETHVFVDPKDDFFTESTIDDSNKIFIIPLLFTDLANSNIRCFSEALLLIVDQADNIHRIRVDLKNCLYNKKYIEQRIRITSETSQMGL